MSIHAKARRHMFGIVIAAPIIIWGIPLLLMELGLPFDEVALLTIPLVLAWMIIGGVRSLLLSCPDCGKSLFMRGFVSVPWPAKRCSRCGADLTVVRPTA
jgi:ribosomal protein S27AE